MASAPTPPGIRAFLFKRLVPLSREAHARLGLRPRVSFQEYQFHWLPLAFSEIDRAAEHYPVVIADTNTPMLAAVVGLHRRQSLHIDQMGRWTGAYLPLYLRQMPFHIVRLRTATDAPAQPAVCVDVDSPLADETFAAKIIDGGKIGVVAEQAIAAAKEFEQGVADSGTFAQMLERSGLAVPLGSLPESADCVALRSLQGVSPARLRDASSQTLAPFSDARVLPQLRACAASLTHVSRLRSLQEQRYSEEETRQRVDL